MSTRLSYHQKKQNKNRTAIAGIFSGHSRFVKSKKSEVSTSATAEPTRPASRITSRQASRTTSRQASPQPRQESPQPQPSSPHVLGRQIEVLCHDWFIVKGLISVNIGRGDSCYGRRWEDTARSSITKLRHASAGLWMLGERMVGVVVDSESELMGAGNRGCLSNLYVQCLEQGWEITIFRKRGLPLNFLPEGTKLDSFEVIQNGGGLTLRR
ncbi:hypothetical protein Glove_549g3 [Diversispora epigaea]|uniref:Uncharacterized protein n=1 Tax=Diversispora epigaea TaxID=1348612 RepID=A0A397GFS3_9GLOM|nr:hypothetical protein Glove_549g3 [Diversispora epigaea]